MRISILLLIICIALSCSSDEGEVVSDFDITLNGVSQPVYDAFKRVESINDGNAIITTLVIEMSGVSCGGRCWAKGFIEIKIITPKAQSIVGNYVFTEDSNNNVTGFFKLFQNPDSVFKSGSFTLTKFGGNHYKIVFNNVVGEWGLGYTINYPSLIDGYFDGNFEDY